MITLPHVVYQSADVRLDFNRHSLVGTTTIWAFFDEDLDLPPHLFLNCRQCKVDKVTVNGEECSFIHNDALKNITVAYSDKDDPSYNGEELDLNFRAALELSRKGELRIDIPEHPLAYPLVPEKLPRRAPREVHSRFEKLGKVQQELQTCDKDARLLVVTVHYCNTDRLDCWGGWSFGYYNPENSSHSHSNRSERANSVVSYAVTRHSSAVSLYDVDGIRSWLPCIDDPSRQSIFDISITVPSYCDSTGSDSSSSILHNGKNDEGTCNGPFRCKYRVCCSGILVSAVSNSCLANGKSYVGDDCTTFRYITPHRIPACAVGIFVGIVKETFVIPLYQAQGHIWVTDSEGIVSAEDEKASINANGKENGREKDKHGKHGGAASVATTTTAAAAVGATLASTAATTASNLAARVKHTFLGFDAAVRHVHKAISRRFPYSRCTVICVPNLECDYLSFDGFLCLNHKWLHTERSIYMETPCHLILLQAYLYTWMKSGILLNSYNSEFVLHGAVGFMVNEYVEFLFGPEDARYRFYKQLQTVINYEKTSSSFPLSCPFPDDYMRCGEVFGRYMLYKSTVLFHIISHRLGSNVDVLLKAIRNVVKTKEVHTHAPGPAATGTPNQAAMAPPMFPPPTPGIGGHITPMASPLLHVGTPYVASPLWTGMGNTSITREESYYHKDMNASMHVQQHAGASSSLLGLARKRSDSIVSVGSDHGDVSLSWKMDPSELKSSNITVTAAAGASAVGVSPLGSVVVTNSPADGNSSRIEEDNLPDIGSLPPCTLTRQISTTSSLGGNSTARSLEEMLWDSDYKGGNASGVSFLADIRDMSGGAGADLNDVFLEQWVHTPGCMFLRAGVHVDTKNKKVDIALHQVGFRSGEVDSSRYAYKDKIPINVVESEVWQYSRRVDGNVQLFSLNIHSKHRKHGGRRKSGIDDSSKSSHGASLDTLSLSDSGKGDVADQKLGRFAYLCAPGDVEGGRVPAQAIASLQNESNGGVQFVAIDPDVNWIREIHLSSPDSLLIEQLYMDMDVVGQIQAMKTLARAHVTTQTIPSQVLRIRALKDVLLNGWNESNVSHSLCVRTEAAYALSQWQNSHAPYQPPPIRGTGSGDKRGIGRANIYEWAGMEVLLGCLRGMFMEAVRITSVASGDMGSMPCGVSRVSNDGNATNAPRIPSHLPLPNNFEDETATLLRSALLVSVASIKAGNGVTPDEIVEELLNFAENNDNSPAAGEKGSDASKTYDDALYCATLLYCLSQIISKDSAILERVIDCAKYYIDREKIVTSSLYEVDIDRTKGVYHSEVDMMESISGGRQSRSFSTGKSGAVTAMALQCICNMEMQLDTAVKASKRGSHGGSTIEASGREKHSVYNYGSYICSATGSRATSHTTPLVRASALDCRLRLAFSKHAARVLEQATHDSASANSAHKTGTAASESTSPPVYGVKLGRIIADCVDLMFSVISTDPCRDVRRCAALSFLYVLQDRDSYIPYQILGLSEPLSTLNWTDPSGLVVYDALSNARTKYSHEHRKAFTGAKGIAVRSTLKKMWEFILSSPTVAYDQSIRSTLLSCWMYTFYARRSGKHKVPKCLLQASEHSHDSTEHGSAATRQMDSEAYKTKFSSLLSSLPSVFGVVKDPVESSADLEEALRVGRYGRQMVRAENKLIAQQLERERRDSQGNAGVLRVRRTSQEPSVSAKRERVDGDAHQDGGDATGSATATKRPRVVKFIMS